MKTSLLILIASVFSIVSCKNLETARLDKNGNLLFDKQANFELLAPSLEIKREGKKRNGKNKVTKVNYSMPRLDVRLSVNPVKGTIDSLLLGFPNVTKLELGSFPINEIAKVEKSKSVNAMAPLLTDPNLPEEALQLFSMLGGGNTDVIQSQFYPDIVIPSTELQQDFVLIVQIMERTRLIPLGKKDKKNSNYPREISQVCDTNNNLIHDISSKRSFKVEHLLRVLFYKKDYKTELARLSLRQPIENIPTSTRDELCELAKESFKEVHQISFSSM